MCCRAACELNASDRMGMSVPDTGSEDLARATLEALSAPNMRSSCLKLLSGALACLRLAHRILAGMPHMPTPCASDAASPSCCVATLVEAEWERSDLPARQQRHFPLAHYYPCLATFRSEMATFSNCRMGFSIFSVLCQTHTGYGAGSKRRSLRRRRPSLNLPNTNTGPCSANTKTRQLQQHVCREK